MGRIEQLSDFVKNAPNDPFPRYALAIELKNAGRLEEAEVVFQQLLAQHPTYTPGYLHAGNVLLALSRQAEAEEVYQRGIRACREKGDAHAESELVTALSHLSGAEPESP